MEYTVDLSVRIGALTAAPDLGDRFLSALEDHHHVMGPAVSQNTATGILSASFNVESSSADTAAQVARDAFCEALTTIGLDGSPYFTEIHIAEESEEAATAV